jgi:integrase
MPRSRRGRGEGGVFKRVSDGLWVATLSLGYDENGKRRRLVAYGATKKEALDKLEEKKGKARAGIVTDADRLTMKEFLDRWLSLVKPKVGAKTYERYEQHVRLQLVPHLGRVKLAKLASLHVEQLYANMTEQGESAAACKKIGTALRMALKQACRLRLVPYNVASDVPLPKPPKEEIAPLDPEQMGRFLVGAESDRLYALYVLALDSGMRQGELFGVRWPEVDFSTSTILVRRSLMFCKAGTFLKDVKTKHARRRIELSPDTMRVLNEHRQRMLAEGRDVKVGPVFCNSAGGFLKCSDVRRYSFQPIFDRVNERAVKEAAEKQVAPVLLPVIRFHDLRHTCATLLLLADENVKVVSERLGHASIQITLDTYSHVLPNMQRRAAQKMAGIFAAARAAAAATS